MKTVKIKKRVIVITFIILVWIVYDFTPLVKVPLANNIYGTSKCTLYNRKKTEDSLETFLFYSDRDHPLEGGAAITNWKCKLCFRGGKSSTTITPELCGLCAEITNRCSECGKLK